MSWIDDNKGSGPWNFTEQSDKPRYNEGDKIATAANPVWSNDHSGVPITNEHTPCGYWFKDYSGMYFPPSVNRITNEYVEVLRAGYPLARITNEYVEVIRAGSPLARITNEYMEVLREN